MRRKVISLKTGNVSSLLYDDVGFIFCGKMVALLRTCFVTVRQRREELAKETAMTRFHAVRISELPTLWMGLFSDLSLGSVLTECEQKRLRTNDDGTFC